MARDVNEDDFELLRREMYSCAVDMVSMYPANARMLNAGVPEQRDKVDEEYFEFKYAVVKESEERQVEELLDLILASIGLLSKYGTDAFVSGSQILFAKGKERGDW